MEKHILYYALEQDRFREMMVLLSRQEDATLYEDPGTIRVVRGDTSLRFVSEADPCRAAEHIHEAYLNLVMLDLRTSSDDRETRKRLERSLCFLENLDREANVEARYDFTHIIVAVGGPDNDVVDRMLARIGAYRVGAVVRDWSLSALCPDELRDDQRAHFGRLVFQEIWRVLHQSPVGRTALCLSGGGITGLYFEVGVLKCLDDCLVNGGVNDFDMFFGISAGAVVSSLLANGYSVDEFMAAVCKEEGGRIPPISLSLFRLAHLDYHQLAHRLRSVSLRMTQWLFHGLTGGKLGTLESFYLDYRDVLPPLWHTETYERMLRDILTAPGSTNRFSALPKPLFIGATDQDLRTHHLFGDADDADVPISRAVQASMSINPVFNSARIGNRYYEDGAVTRTTNFEEAIKRGADLVFVVDPFVPYVSKVPGHAHERGLAYNVDQDLRTISYTRFERTRRWALRHDPHVSIYAFLPANHIRRLMSTFPMDHRPFLKIWRGAYLSTLNRIQNIGYRLRGDLDKRGIKLDTSRAEMVGEQLRSGARLSLASFFPDGRIDIKTPPLALERRADLRGRRMRTRTTAKA